MKKKPQNSESFSINRIADLTSIDRMTIRRRLAEVKPERTKGRVKFYSAEDALRAAKPVPRQSENSALEATKTKLQIERIEFDNAKARGDFRPVAAMKLAATRYAFAVRNQFWGIPRIVAARLALLTDPLEVEMDLQAVIREGLTLLSKTPFGDFHCPHCKKKIVDAEPQTKNETE